MSVRTRLAMMALAALSLGSLVIITGSPAEAAPGAGHVSIPSGYKYNLNHPRRSLHDYCTKSPDAFFAANFRGPCARHDMCFEAAKKTRQKCNNEFWSHLNQECTHAFAWYNPLRGQCYNVRDVYWVAVTANTFFNG